MHIFMGPQMEPQTICWNYYLNLLTSAGYYSVSYCHLSSSKATIGRYVKAGEIIGVSGNTGMSTGPHLHLTIKKDGKAIDPIILLNCIQTIVSLK